MTDMEYFIDELEQLNSKQVLARAKALPVNELRELVNYLDEKYETGDTGLVDWRYDILQETLVKRAKIDIDKEFKGKKGDTGVAGVDEEEKIKLPFFMGSAQKVKADDDPKLQKWLKKNPAPGYMVSAKLDGISCLAVYEPGKQPMLFTRGRKGTHGRDISFLVGKVPTIPRKISTPLAVRGELVMPLKTFEKKYKGQYENARAIVQGLVGSKSAGAKDLHFVTYEVLSKGLAPPPEEQFAMLNSAGFEVVHHQIIAKPTIDELLSLIVEYKANSPYLLDGIIIQSNIPVKRTTKKYPDYMFAFKLDAPAVEVKVLDVEYSIGKWKQLAPTLVYERTLIDGFWNERASAHTANHVLRDKLGPGAVVKLIRSGDVMPKYVSVVKPAKEPKMPEGNWHWDENHTHAIAEAGEAVDRAACIKRIRTFMKTEEVNEFGPSRIQVMYDNGMDSLLKIFEASEEEIIEAVGSEAVGRKMYKNVRKLLTNPNIPEMVGASGALGKDIGVERAEQLVDAIPDIFTRGVTDDQAALKAEIMAIPGFGAKVGATVAQNLYWASGWANAVEMLATWDDTEEAAPPEAVGNALAGQLYVVTGFTAKTSPEAKDVLDTIIAQGGEWSTKWKGSVTGVIAGGKSIDKGSAKISKAEKAGLPVYDVDKFLNEVGLA